jgi:1-acyl-sn-glycerol-3-phosphate acyltransferase
MPEEQLVPMKAQVYKDPRPKEFFDQFHHRSRTRSPEPMYSLVRTAVTLYGLGFFRETCISSDKVPQSGPVILAPNHFSFMDHFFLGSFTRRKVRFMAKSQMFKAKGLLTFIYTMGGVFPVRRGHRDEEAFITAQTILENGGCVAMYCEGGRSRTGKLSDKAKPGIGRLALETGAPIVPVAIYGSSKVRNWKKLQFPKVVVQYGDPIRWERTDDPTRDQQQAVADEIFANIGRLYSGLETLGRRGVMERIREERRALRRRKRKRTAPA